MDKDHEERLIGAGLVTGLSTLNESTHQDILKEALKYKDEAISMFKEVIEMKNREIERLEERVASLQSSLDSENAMRRMERTLIR